MKAFCLCLISMFFVGCAGIEDDNLRVEITSETQLVCGGEVVDMPRIYVMDEEDILNSLKLILSERLQGDKWSSVSLTIDPSVR